MNYKVALLFFTCEVRTLLSHKLVTFIHPLNTHCSTHVDIF